VARKDYSKIHDPEAERTRAELWIIIGIVVVVVVGALVFRVIRHRPATPSVRTVPLTQVSPPMTTPGAVAPAKPPPATPPR
jgi:hypothetical protein